MVSPPFIFLSSSFITCINISACSQRLGMPAESSCVKRALASEGGKNKSRHTKIFAEKRRAPPLTLSLPNVHPRERARGDPEVKGGVDERAALCRAPADDVRCTPRRAERGDPRPSTRCYFIFQHHFLFSLTHSPANGSATATEPEPREVGGALARRVPRFGAVGSHLRRR